MPLQYLNMHKPINVWHFVTKEILESRESLMLRLAVVYYLKLFIRSHAMFHALMFCVYFLSVILIKGLGLKTNFVILPSHLLKTSVLLSEMPLMCTQPFFPLHFILSLAYLWTASYLPF